MKSLELGSIVYRFRVIGSYLSKVAYFDQPYLHLSLRWGWPRSNFVEIFGIKILESLAIVWCCLFDSAFSLLIQYWSVTDRQTQTHDDGIYRASIASRGKNLSRGDRQTADIRVPRSPNKIGASSFNGPSVSPQLARTCTEMPDGCSCFKVICRLQSFQMGCFSDARFLLKSASRFPSAIAELLVRLTAVSAGAPDLQAEASV